LDNERKTVTRADLVNAVARKGRLTHSASTQIVEEVLAEITDALTQGQAVRLHGSASFTIISKRARLGRNPKTGVEATISPRNVLSFKASPTLLKLINFK
jgi:integration host factor subunit alpha